MKPGSEISGELIESLVETHISWVILCHHYVYKIKKPVKLSFLDFSTLELRKKYCERELMLNKRLAPDMYLSVVAMREADHGAITLDGRGILLDYAVKMKRMNNELEMRQMLESKQVTANHIVALAQQIASFHQKIEIISNSVRSRDLSDDFLDILQIEGFAKEKMGKTAIGKLQRVIGQAKSFLGKYEDKILERSERGMIRDGHGDLHSGNIFLTDPPVIFDCIEFNDHFRRIDILNEVAFFCMDLEFYGETKLAVYFMREYTGMMQIEYGEFEKKLFLFYKFYRANVKTKVNAIKAMQEQGHHDRKDRSSLFEQYFSLMVDYGEELEFSLQAEDR